jgi:UDP-N-acetylglucosamine--N-acetylmuramyl-(pentapeptide) pyrophosphoryl-undecaprenol N-acetylglucosamine transferase
MALKWAIAGGGTGGHVTMALALGEVMRERGESVVFIGAETGLEMKLVPEAGFELVALPSEQVMGQSVLGRLHGMLRILSLVGRARTALRTAQADAVISVGGFAAMPAVLAAVLGRRPLLLVEPNAIPGRVNRLSARFAQRVYVGFEAAAKWLGGTSPKIRPLGIPLRAGLIEAFERAPARQTPSPPIHLLVFGGSQGARQLNEAMMELAPRLKGQPITLFHQTGAADRERVAAAYMQAGVEAEVVEFERDMPSRYRWADVALCRAGALTVAELALSGLPALLVPYPFAADDHQGANARALEDARAGECVESRPLDVDALGDRLLALAADPAPLSEMSRAATSLGRPSAARAIVEDIAGLLGGEASKG